MEITSPNYEVGFQYLLAWISPVSEMNSMPNCCFPGCVCYRLTWEWGQISWTLLWSWFLIIPLLQKAYKVVYSLLLVLIWCMWDLQLCAVTPGCITCVRTESGPRSQLQSRSSSDSCSVIWAGKPTWPKQTDADFVVSVHGVCFLAKQIILMDSGLALDLNTNWSQERERQEWIWAFT